MTTSSSLVYWGIGVKPNGQWVLKKLVVLLSNPETLHIDIDKFRKSMNKTSLGIDIRLVDQQISI
jgi:hypothetical protein